LALVALCATAALGQNAWYEGFEGPNNSWREAGGDMSYHVERHQRIRGEAHTGNQCELISIRAEQGTAVYFDHEVGQPRIIDELRPTLWIKADRPGLQVLARVVLPRTFDPRSGQPAYVLIPGGSYREAGTWQQLSLDDLSRLLVRQARVLRCQLGPMATVDEHEAYLDRIVLNVYGGAGVTNVCIDDLDIAGFVARPPGAGDPVAGRPAAMHRDANADPLVRWMARVDGPVVAQPYPAISGRPVQPAKAALTGSILLAEGHPLLPRIIQYQGEPLEFLTRLGFNAVWLAQPPSPDLMAEAERLHLWVVCPPPLRAGAETPPEATEVPEIGPELDNVLAWDLGPQFGGEQPEAVRSQALETVRSRAIKLRAADPRRGRPLIVATDSDLRNYSRVTGLLLLGRQVLGASMEMSDYAAWLRNRQLLAEPGTPVWAAVQTQLPAALVEQLGVLIPGRPVPLAVSSEQIRLMAYTALAAGSRGLLFESQSPLNATDAETRYRAMSLELLNLALVMIEPWVAGGSPLTSIGCKIPEITGTALRSDHACLMLPIWSSPNSQYVLGQAAGNTVSLVAPGVPETSWAYELIPGGLRTLRNSHVMGGYQVTMEEFGPVAQIALTQDPLVILTLTRQSTAAGRRAAELARELATREFEVVQRVAAEVGPRAATGRQTNEWLVAARRGLLECSERLSAKDQEYQGAYLAAQRAMRPMRLLERACWDTASKRLLVPAASPAAASFATLPWQWRLIDDITSSQPGPNRLPGGDFEDLPTTLGAGWRNFPRPLPGIESLAELVPQAKHSGEMGMHLLARPTDPKNVPAVIETAPLWIITPPVPVAAGDVVRIHGWVKTVLPVTGSSDGLSIFDSIAGEAFAERIVESFGWHEFTLFRCVPRSGPLTVTFALNGLGEVYLDEVSVEVLEPLSRLGNGRVAGQR
jgi:hypothetical protein